MLKYIFLSTLVLLSLSWAQLTSSEPINYQELFADNLSRGGQVLNLSGKNIGDEGLKILLKQDFIKKLKKLDLRYNDISPNGAETLAHTPPLPKLKTLILKHNFFADEGTVALANSRHFPNLEELQLSWNEVRDAGALALANSKNFPKLKKLDLRGNFFAGKTKKIINVKKGQFLAPWDMVNVTKKIADSGNQNILVTERGASFGYNTLVSDMRSLPIMAKNGYPVIFDATHSVQQPGGQGESSGGQREFVEYLARAAVAVGVAGVFIETHQDPDNAPSDGPNMVPLNKLENLLNQLTDIDNLIKK